jgi:hypothetical protein
MFFLMPLMLLGGKLILKIQKVSQTGAKEEHKKN